MIRYKTWLTTGTRNGFSRIGDVLDALMDEYGRPHQLVHGGGRGVDAQAAEWAEALGVDVVWFRANWNRFGRRAGPIRNQEMVDYARNKDAVCIAFPRVDSIGTLDCMLRAGEAGIRVIEHLVEKE